MIEPSFWQAHKRWLRVEIVCDMEYPVLHPLEQNVPQEIGNNRSQGPLGAHADLLPSRFSTVGKRGNQRLL